MKLIAYRAIRVHLHGDGHRTETRGIHADELHRISNAIRLARRNPDRIRAYVAECCGIWPEVVGRPKSVPPSPPSGPMVAGD